MTKKPAALPRNALFLSVVLFLLAAPAFAQSHASLGQQIDKIIHQPVYRHASFGIEVYSLDEHKVVYQRNAQKLFTPASTTKLLTEGTALELLGADYRFHTRIYRTGPVESDSTLKGDLVLVASGDPNLSGRIQADGTLAFENVDHAYDGSPDTKAVPGDPLLVIRELAKQVAARGIKQIDGRVLVDVSLFPEGDRELGTGVVISPIVVNDNLVDVTATPGANAGDPVRLHVSLETAYVKFVNQATTGAAGSRRSIEWAKDEAQPDGSHVVTVGGTLPMGGPSILYSYAVPQPSRFAEMTLVEALREAGVQAGFAPYGAAVDFGALAASYVPGNAVAEHVSPPFSEEIKVTLKVSQNLHASTTPYLIGALVGHKKENILQAGFDLEHAFLAKGGLDLSGASQSDGAGGAVAAFFTPDFMCHYLAFMTKQKNFALFHRALPVLGRDGTLWNIQVHSPAAGHVHAKTGTFIAEDRLNHNLMVTGKGLAGYLTAADGRRYTFALYANRVSLPMGNLEAAENEVGGTLGAIASAIYNSRPGRAKAAGEQGGRE
jgi:PBP4 family serine-type D-alanyl-D-alanine carboxypeptidase